ncbi:protein kinase, partial [Planctomycetota bacterium]
MAELQSCDLESLDDRFQVLKILGKGGFGEVYKGRRLVPPQDTVALKVCEMPLVDREQAVLRLLREVKNARRLDHQNAVSVYEHGNLGDGRFYYAMEICDGPPLRDVMAIEEFPQPRIARIVIQVLDALAAAHALGMVHRDMKPENVHLVPGPDGRESVKVLDFGLAKVMSGSQSQELTAQGQIIGTVSYMAPEQLRGQKMDGRVDLYAVGIMLYELLAGVRPYTGANPKEIMGHHLKSPVPSLRKQLGRWQCSRKLDALLIKALAKRPEERFASAEEMADALKAAIPQALTYEAPFVKQPAEEAAASSTSDLATADLDQAELVESSEQSTHKPAVPPSGVAVAPGAKPPFPPLPQFKRPTGGPTVEPTMALTAPGAKPPFPGVPQFKKPT